MDKNIKSKLSFLGYNVKEVYFKENDSFKSSDNPIGIDFSLSHNTKIEKRKWI